MVSLGSVILLSLLVAAVAIPQPEERFFTQKLDHFRFDASGKTFEQRYLVHDAEWTGKGQLKNGCRGPILFYTGNEGPIDAFWAGNGFMLDVLAPKWGAVVLFGEHRYYGKSMPFGDDSLKPGNNAYLSTEQALADYAELLTSFKAAHSATNCPVIAFGGSYGGTLTAYFRFKYPNVVAGGLAASAPIGYYDPAAWKSHNVTEFTWMDIVNQQYEDAGCLAKVTRVVELIPELVAHKDTASQLQRAFHLCDVPTDAQPVVNMWTDVLENLPQSNYPYAIGHLPGYPVAAVCSFFENATTSDPKLLVAAAGAASDMYYNYGGQCLPGTGLGGIPGGGPPGLGDGVDSWGFQSCTETLHPFSARGIRNFTFSLADAGTACNKAFGVSPRLGWAPLQFGGYAIGDGHIGATNIIFSNGLLDPWHGGGFLRETNPSCPVLIMPSGAHHLDLRGPNPADPDDVTATRIKEEAILWAWIEEASAE